jgi:hypothetical protein
MDRSPDRYRYILSQPIDSAPGTQWRYKDLYPRSSVARREGFCLDKDLWKSPNRTSAQEQLFVGIQNRESRTHRMSHLRGG